MARNKMDEELEALDREIDMYQTSADKKQKQQEVDQMEKQRLEREEARERVKERRQARLMRENSEW